MHWHLSTWQGNGKLYLPSTSVVRYQKSSRGNSALCLKVNLHTAICRPDLSASINREANWFMYNTSTAHAFFCSQNFFIKRFGKQMTGDDQLVCFHLKYHRYNLFCANSFAGCVFVLKIRPDTRKSVKQSQIFLNRLTY